MCAGSRSRASGPCAIRLRPIAHRNTRRAFTHRQKPPADMNRNRFKGGTMIRAILRPALAASFAALCAIAPARADKAHDTLRVAFDQPVRLIDSINNPNPESNLVD